MGVQNNYFGWSVYTAYTDPKTMGNWVAAKWPGREITSSSDLKEDIDFRVDRFMEALQVAMMVPTNESTRYFVVPEFYFHSCHGPYPGIEVNHESPFNYLIESLDRKIQAVIENSHEADKTWVICTGSVLTTHVSNIIEFLNRSEVTARLNELNTILSTQQKEFHRPNHIGIHRLRAAVQCHDRKHDPFERFNAQVNEYRLNPLCTVRNRAAILVYHGVDKSITRHFIEKQGESTVDLTLGEWDGRQLTTGNQITEWLANYPPISILNGDNQNHGSECTGARFSIDGPGTNTIQVGAEICLDHRLQRLRRTVDMPYNPPLDIQLVPSGGMQLLDYSMSGKPNSAIFNVDGCDSIVDVYNAEGKNVIVDAEGRACNGYRKDVITGVYCASQQTVHTGTDGKHYCSHTQLAFRTNESGPEGYLNPLGTNNRGGETYIMKGDKPLNVWLDGYDNAIVLPVPVHENVELFFTAGLGEIHGYCPKV